jgi:5-methylcytosine-specific restriction endonuclease McrA
MAREFAGNFYKTKLWKECRAAYIQSVGGLCERCWAKGLIRHGDTVHHKVPLTPENIHDPAVTLNHDNLELLCRDCHAEEHRSHEQRYTVDEWGRVIAK